MRLPIILSGSVLLLLSASGGRAQPLGVASITPSPSPSASSSSTSTPTPSPAPVFSPPAASQRSVYFSRLRPLNNSGVWGQVMIVVDNASVGALVRAIGLAPGMQHSQYVESGALCPDQSADQNNDGYIDSLEAANVSGLPFLSLGFSDGTFPIPSEAGKTNFIGTVGGQTGSQPTTTASSIASPGVSSGSPSTTQSLNNLSGLAVMINGVSPNTQLPSSVQDLKGTADLPVACGRLRQNLE